MHHMQIFITIFGRILFMKSAQIFRLSNVIWFGWQFFFINQHHSTIHVPDVAGAAFYFWLSAQHSFLSRDKWCEFFLWLAFTCLKPALLLFPGLWPSIVDLECMAYALRQATPKIWRWDKQREQFVVCTHKNLEKCSGFSGRIMTCQLVWLTIKICIIEIQAGKKHLNG